MLTSWTSQPPTPLQFARPWDYGYPDLGRQPMRLGMGGNLVAAEEIELKGWQEISGMFGESDESLGT